MWTYSQSSGILRHDNKIIGTGYSGRDSAKNNPDLQDRPNLGPIPRGRYLIDWPRDTQTHGPHVLPLIPAPENDMHGRSGFLIHGDSLASPGHASEGCIILDRATRDWISASGDHLLEVVQD